MTSLGWGKNPVQTFQSSGLISFLGFHILAAWNLAEADSSVYLCFNVLRLKTRSVVGIMYYNAVCLCIHSQMGIFQAC